MLDLIRRPPLVSNLRINGENVVEGGEVEHGVGEAIILDIKMSNQLLEPVCDAELSVRLVQDSLGPRGLVGGAAVAGTPGLGQLGEVMPGQEVEHVTRLLALAPGTFKLCVSSSVSFRDRPNSWRLAPTHHHQNLIILFNQNSIITFSYKCLRKLYIIAICDVA